MRNQNKTLINSWERIVGQTGGAQYPCLYCSLETGIYPFSLNKAFLEIYNGQKFKIILEEAVDKALDEVFLRLIVTEGYFNEKEDLQEQLEHSYYVDLQKEVSRLATKNGIQSEMRALMDSILKKKFIDCNLEKLYEKQ